MSLYKDASLVMIPSAYKDGKLYSIRPTDGSGDFTFSRGSNLAATRVDVNGLIEKGRENLLTYSNAFTSGNWTTANISLTSGQSGYDGSNDAWLAQGNGLGTSRLQHNGLNWTNSVYSLSFYAKAGTESVVNVYDGTWSGVIGATYDLSTGTATQYPISIPVVEAKMVAIGNGWWRCSFTAIPNAFTNTAGFVRIGIGSTTAANSGNIYIQDAQLEAGLVATDYIETGASTAQAGILEDMPRLDYSGSCPALLLEPQRTNMIIHSEYFDAWNQNAVDLDFGYLAPDGTYSAYKVTDNTGQNNASLYLGAGLYGGITRSIWARTTSGTGEVDLMTYFENTNNTFTITEEWQRFDILDTTTAVGLGNFYAVDFRGGGLNEVILWGAQAEVGSYPTSYIPTYGSSVTRSRDAMNNSSLGLTDCTFFVDFVPRSSVMGLLDFYDNSNARAFYIAINSIKYLTFNSVLGGTIGSVGPQLNIGETIKLAFTLNASTGDITIFVNGTKYSTYSTTISSLNKILQVASFGYYNNTEFNQISAFPTALTDSECIALTTL